MGTDLITDTPEERERQKREATKKRFRNLAVILGVALLARIIIKDPPKYKEPDHSNAPMRYLPGMLQGMPREAVEKLDTATIIKLQEADDRARYGISAFEEDWIHEPYVPAETMPEITEDIEAYKEQVFQYAKKRKKIEAIHEKMEVDYSKSTLVLFRRGGFVKVEKVNQEKSGIRIRFDRSLTARYPKHMVRVIRENAIDWEEPIPKGYVKITPAKGVTMIVKKGTATRIQSIKKNIYEI